jgi:hypothetical protein
VTEYHVAMRWDHDAESLENGALERHFHIPAIAALVKRGCVPPFPVSIEVHDGEHLLVMRGKDGK